MTSLNQNTVEQEALSRFEEQGYTCCVSRTALYQCLLRRLKRIFMGSTPEATGTVQGGFGTRGVNVPVRSQIDDGDFSHGSPCKINYENGRRLTCHICASFQ